MSEVKPHLKTMSDAQIRKHLLLKVRELLATADRWTEAGDDRWMVVYCKAALSLAKTLQENYPKGVR